MSKKKKNEQEQTPVVAPVTEEAVVKSPKKKPVAFLIVLGILVLCAAIVVPVYLVKSIGTRNRAEKNIYLALEYLGVNNRDMASAYLDKVEKTSKQNLNFASDCAEVLQNKLSGNTTLSKIKVDMLRKNYKLNDTKELIVNYFDNNEQSSDNYQAVINKIVSLMNISDKRLAKYDLQFTLEKDAMINGYLSDEDKESYEKLCGEKAGFYLELSVALSNGDYQSAFDQAVSLVKKSASEDNRLLLADVVARAAYSGNPITQEQFYLAMDEEYDPVTAEKEFASLNKKIQKGEDRLSTIQLKIDSEKDDDKRNQLGQVLREQLKELELLNLEKENVTAYKALNSIADIHSLEADLVETKLLYAVGKSDEALEKLAKTSNSYKVDLADNEKIKQGFNVIASIQNGDTKAATSPLAIETIEKMLNISTGDVVICSSSDVYGYGRKDLAADLVGEFVSGYKYANSGIYISNVDASKFPEISFTVNACEEILSDLVHKRQIEMKDTHAAVDYKAKMAEGTTSSICFLVDTSGSMSGTAIQDAKESLIYFADTMTGNSEIAMVDFDSSASVVAPLSHDLTKFVDAANRLDADGGTNFDNAIQIGMEALEGATSAKNIIMMTDGQCGVSDDVIQEAAARGIKIFTVGFGDVEEEVLSRIAETTSGTFTLAASSADLGKVYESLGAVIGNSVQVVYTVKENLDEPERYIFIHSNRYDSSKKYVYREGEKTIANDADGFCISDSRVLALDDMERRAQQKDKVGITFTGAKMDKVVSVTIAGRTYQPDPDGRRSEDRLYIEMDPLTSTGLFDAKFTFEDGSEYFAQNAVLIYDDNQENSYIRRPAMRIGAVLVEANNMYILPDGTRVLQGVRFYNYDMGMDNCSDESLNASTENLVVLQKVTPSEATINTTRYQNWGETGEFVMDGVMILVDSDAQLINGGRSYSAIGKVVGTINGSGCTLNQK